MGDLIEREAAIDAIERIRSVDTYADLEYAKDIFRNIPPAQPERKRGKWIQNNNGTYSCSLCHSWIPEEQYYYAQFCLYCGADMRGEQHETN